MKRAFIATLILAALSCALLGIDVALHAGAFLHAYLAAFAFLASTVLGALVLWMVAKLTAASWFVVMRRLAEAIASVMPLLFIAFVPIALGLKRLYPWAQSFDGLDEGVRRSLQHARAWMNAPLFLARAAFFIALWTALEEAMRRSSVNEDAGRVERAERNFTRLSAIGLPVLGFSASFATFDWVMSAVPGLNSNILGLYLLCGGFSSAMGVFCVVFHLARQRGVFPPEVSRFHTHALGRMLLMSVCLWAYIAASQLVIMWSANLPKEAGFYLARFQGPFRALAIALVVAHFAVPFFLLLSRWLKQSSFALALLGALIVVTHAVDMYWLLVPAAPRGASSLDFAAFTLLGALGTAFGAWRFTRAAAVPAKAPELERSLAYESP